MEFSTFTALKLKLKEFRASSQFMIKKSTNFVMVGKKKEISQMYIKNIEKLNNKGADIKIIHIEQQ